MKNIIFLLITLIPILTFGQESIPDTVFVKRDLSEEGYTMDTLYIEGGLSMSQVLAGTTFLTFSDKMIGLLNRGLSPISIEKINQSKASHSREHKQYPIVSNVSRDSTTLTIDAIVSSNCCRNFLVEAEVIGEDTLNLIYKSYGGFCSCCCLYTLRYKFNTILEKDYKILKYVMVDGKKESITEIPKPEK